MILNRFAQVLEHHQRVHVAGGRVLVGGGEAAEGLETAAFPQRDRAQIGGDDEVELDGAVAARAGMGEGVPAHGAGDAAAGGVGGGHVAAIGDMGAAAGLVGADVVGAEDVDFGFGFGFGHEDLVAWGGPVGEGCGLGHVAGKRVGFAGADDGVEDAPDRGVVGRGRGADDQRRGRP